jgi:ABC-2 type transport system permease protein
MGSLGDLAATFESTDMAASSPFGEAEISMVEVTVNRDLPRSAYEVSFPQALMWGLIAVAATFALSIVGERTRGTYLRLRVAPISRVHILAGKGLACFTVCASVCVFLLAFGSLLLGVRIVNPVGLVMAVIGCATCFTGIMMLVSVLGKTERAVSGGSWAILLVASMLGGGMVPLIAMPSWMLTISHLSPVKWGIVSLEGAIWRGFTTADMLLPVGILLAIGAAAFAIGVTVLARYDR